MAINFYFYQNLYFNDATAKRWTQDKIYFISYISVYRLKWMVTRIKDYCSEWQKAARNIPGINIEDKKEKILIIIGLLVEETKFGFAKNALHGGPLGEFVQWTDTIASLFTLNYNITLYIDRSDLLKCKFRVLDTFGTESQFNSDSFICYYCGYKLNLKQYFTMFR
ncbi:hypothetical protein HZS_240 [Henneguya salminicola]|nr:hypothetical protein HZS_240 [Henneguya salminicola]